MKKTDAKDPRDEVKSVKQASASGSSPTRDSRDGYPQRDGRREPYDNRQGYQAPVDRAVNDRYGPRGGDLRGSDSRGSAGFDPRDDRGYERRDQDRFGGRDRDRRPPLPDPRDRDPYARDYRDDRRGTGGRDYDARGYREDTRGGYDNRDGSFYDNRRQEADNRHDRNDRYGDRGRDSRDARGGMGGPVEWAEPGRAEPSSLGKKRTELLESLAYTTRADLKKIGDWMRRYNVTDLSRVMRSEFDVRDQVWTADLEDFVNFLQSSQLQVSSKSAMAVAREFLMPPSGRQWDKQQLVNLDQLTDAIIGADLAEADREYLTKGRANNTASAQLLERVAALVEQYVAHNGGSVFKVFQLIDDDGCNYITEDEMLKGLHKLGGTELTMKDAKRILEALDTNNDGKASYVEFTRLLSSMRSGGACIDDPHHWAFALCEDLRRKIGDSGQSMVSLFFAGLRDPKQLESAKPSDLNVPWHDFLKTLDRLKIRMRPDEEAELQELFDAKGPRGDGQVNLAVLQSMLGIAEDFAPQNEGSYNRYVSQPTEKRDKGRRETIDLLMRNLIESGASVPSLRLEFAVEARDKQTISKEAFKKVIDFEIQASAPIPGERLNVLADLFETKSGTAVDYEAFLEAFAAAQGMEKAQAYLFAQLETLLSGKGAKQSVTELLRSVSRDQRATSLNADELQGALRELDISIRPDEIKQLLLRYDPSGHAKLLELRGLETAFEEWRTTTGKNRRRTHPARRQQLYDEFQDYCGEAPRGGGARHNHERTEEEKIMKEVVTAFAGDDRFLAAGFRQLDQFGRGVMITDFARFIVDEAPIAAKFYARDVERMLTTLARSRELASDADIQRFTAEFTKMREEEGIKAGVYRGRHGRSEAAEVRDPGPRNPLLPGQSQTQTRAGSDRRPGAPKVAPRGFVAPRRVDSQLFEEIMCCAYLKGVLVEDHFEQSARPLGRGLGAAKLLDLPSFEDALAALGLRWSP